MRKKLEKVPGNTYTQYATFGNLLCLLVKVDRMESSVKSGITENVKMLNYLNYKYMYNVYIM